MRCPHCGQAEMRPNDVGLACYVCGKEVYSQRAIARSLWRTLHAVEDGPRVGVERHSHDGMGSRYAVASE